MNTFGASTAYLLISNPLEFLYNVQWAADHFVTTPQSEDREEQREKELSTARSWEGSWPPPGFINKKGMQMFCTLFEKKVNTVTV